MRLLRICCVAGIFAAALSFTHLSFTKPTFAGNDVTGSLPKDTKDIAIGTTSGLPVPRFVSLKSDHVNVRGGPTKDNDVSWIYTKSGLPVEITAEFENWRRIRDSEGSEGWVYHSLLSGKRTAVVTTKSKDELAQLHDRADDSSAIAAQLEAGVVANVRRCSGTWCRISGAGFDGWIEQERLWGVYPDEKVD
jgi:SH3-like domain-containing protein